MSWLARSLANLTASEDDDEGIEPERDTRERRSGAAATAEASAPASEDEESGPLNPGRGVKEDLSELTKTLTRQLWGVASFLAPPPSSSSQPPNPSPSLPPQISADDSSPSYRVLRSDSSDPAVSRDSDLSDIVPDSPRIAGIRNDFAEIGGRFRTGISRLSKNKAVSEISKIASSFLPFGTDGFEEEEVDEKELEEKFGSGDGTIGVTKEVLAFARNISMHPETWLDFPLFPEDEDSDDFDMSDAQQEHALAVEHLAPRLAALRIELCPSHMSEGCFWKIYFVLLHSRLNKHDAELLSTPQIVEARALLLQELQNRTKPALNRSGSGKSYGKGESAVLSGEQLTTSGVVYESIPVKTATLEEPTPTSDFETEKHPVVTTDIKIIDKSVVEEELPIHTKDIGSEASKISVKRYEEDGDDWLEEETTDMGGSGVTSIPLGDEEDVSFSDLEEDDEKAPTSSKTVTNTFHSQAKDSRDWVQLGKSSGDSAKDGNSLSLETKESNEWLNLDDIDVV